MQTDEIKSNLMDQISLLREEKRVNVLVNEKCDLKHDEEVEETKLQVLPHLIFYDKKRFVIEEPRH